MFRLSKITDYGILLLAHMASSDGSGDGDSKSNDRATGKLHTARELAESVDLPLPVVSKVLKSLARQGTIESHRGAKGGYSLRADATEITVAEMIAVLEGPVAMTECAASSGLCLHEDSCSVRDPWQVINRVVKDALSQITLADLVQTTSSGPNPLDRFIRPLPQPSAALQPDGTEDLNNG
ncbi:MAG: FeS assembly SUF system regulator [Myxococcota bacterium]|jgi:FeS assembly SUF system regulator